MQDFWNQVILSNPLKKYVIVAAVILVTFLVRRMVSRMIAGLLYRSVRRVSTSVNKDSFINLVITPLESFLVVVVALVTIHKLHFPEYLDFDVYDISSKNIVHGIATSAFILAFFWLLLRIIDFIALLLKWKMNRSDDPKDNQLIIFLRDFLKAIIGIIGILMILNFAFKFQVSNVWTGLGIAGAALALATKESIENLIASFIIFFDKPFTTGDVIKLNNISGTVERIGLRSTRIRTEVKTFVTVPNKQMVDSVVDNLTLRTQRKAELRLQIGLLTPSNKVAQLMDGIKKILDREMIENPTVFFNDIATNALLIYVDFFTAPISLLEFNEIKQAVNMELLLLMENLEIQIAGASTDIHLVNS
jgi:MscS family membrane protein